MFTNQRLRRGAEQQAAEQQAAEQQAAEQQGPKRGGDRGFGRALIGRSVAGRDGYGLGVGPAPHDPGTTVVLQAADRNSGHRRPLTA